MKDPATELLHAFARSDLDAIDRLCAEDVFVWGTDAGEVWDGKAAVVASFAGAFDLRVEWVGEPLVRHDWVAGDAEFALGDGTRVPARVTMVFREGLLAHAHYSVAAESGT
jgi:ketosteroid isomerase-like protein